MICKIKITVKKADLSFCHTIAYEFTNKEHLNKPCLRTMKRNCIGLRPSHIHVKHITHRKSERQAVECKAKLALLSVESLLLNCLAHVHFLSTKCIRHSKRYPSGWDPGLY